MNNNADYLLNFVIPQGPTGPTGITGPTGPTGETESFDTYAMATLTNKNTYANNSPLLFNTTSPLENITYSNGTFTLPNAGTYLINWTASIKNESSSAVLSLALYEVTPTAGIISSSNTGHTISNNASTIINGTAIVTVTANTTFQLRNISGQTISTVPNSNSAATLTITRIN
jgi:hypothetical protein